LVHLAAKPTPESEQESAPKSRQSDSLVGIMAGQRWMTRPAMTALLLFYLMALWLVVLGLVAIDEAIVDAGAAADCGPAEPSQRLG
jgi:hypothetical protein